MIALLLALAQVSPTNMPPCKSGASECNPWDRAWANPFDQFDPRPTPFSGPAKLIITWYQGGIVAVDYPSQSRCEQARGFVQAEVRRRYQASQASMPPGSVTVGVSPNGAFCIPG